MSETKFTPGPWEYRKAGKVNLSGEVPRVLVQNIQTTP